MNPEVVEYPCEVPIKAMGIHAADFAEMVLSIIRRHAPDADSFTTRDSANGKYISVTITIRAHSRAQLETIYRDLKTSGRVVMVL